MEENYIAEIRNVRNALDSHYSGEVRGLVVLLQGINNTEGKSLKQFLYDNINMEKETDVKEAVDAMTDIYFEKERILIRPEWEEMLLNEAPERFIKANYLKLKKFDCVEYLPRFAYHYGELGEKRDTITEAIKIENHVIIKIFDVADNEINYYVSMRDENKYKNIFRNIESMVFNNVEKAMAYLIVGDDFFDSVNLMRKEYIKRMESKD